MIQLYDIFKSFDHLTPALTKISIKFNSGEFVIIYGPSGAGKTTLLKLIYRDLLPEKGSLLFNGENIVKMPIRKIPYYRRNIGFIFQDTKLISNKTIFDNISIMLRICELPEEEVYRKTNNILSFMNLSHKKSLFPYQLSQGEQQKIAIARSIVNGPKLLLADEPVLDLDRELTVEIMNLFHNINKNGTTILFVTNQETLVEKYIHLPNKIVQLENGKIQKIQTSN
ncbi:MAG: ATP-binding cassette domain-containing protein [bacterium]|nr:ATP-binding cassette domain-containing protein [bacterium]